MVFTLTVDVDGEKVQTYAQLADVIIRQVVRDLDGRHIAQNIAVGDHGENRGPHRGTFTWSITPTDPHNARCIGQTTFHRNLGVVVCTENGCADHASSLDAWAAKYGYGTWDLENED